MENASSSISKNVSIDTLLVLEKSFETAGQQWVENLNILEQLLVGIVENFARESNEFRANFIIRRLPTYTAPFVNKNEYGIVVENINFTLTSPHATDRDSLVENPIKTSVGNVEIFSVDEISDGENENSCTSRSLDSQEIFKKFSNVFQKIFMEEIEREDGQSTPQESASEKVQLLGPHLLSDLKCNPDVQRIFTLTQPRLSLSKAKRSNCRLTIDASKLILSLELDGSSIIVRPCLFLPDGYARFNNILLERIPLFHPAILSIGESLTKGCLLSPSSSESMWTFQFWPCESHIISIFHPNSIICRIFKIYGAFCLAPSNLWEYLNEEGADGMIETSFSMENNIFTVDFFLSSFLFELEKFPKIDDWAPSNFTTRFMSLLKSAVDSYEKGFYPHYITKTNILQGLWRSSSVNGEPEEASNLKDIEEAPSDVVDYGDYEQERYKEHYPSDLDELDDDFGFQLDRLSVQEEKELAARGKPPSIRKVNPFASLADSNRSSIDGPPVKQKARSLSQKLGVNILKRFSMVNKERAGSSRVAGDRPKSMTDIASGFEEMVNQMRREETIHKHNISENVDIVETSFSPNQKQKQRNSITSSVQELVDSSNARRRSSVAFDNQGFLHKDSVYSLILQFLIEKLPSEYFADSEMRSHLEKAKKVVYSQGELIHIWNQVMEEAPKMKYICPHTFSLRQIQYISLVLQTLTKCSPNNMSGRGECGNPGAKMPSWEISGDILRTVLYQLRSEVLFNDSIKLKEKIGQIPRKISMKSSKSFSEGSNRNSKAGRFSKFSFRRGAQDICKGHSPPETEANAEASTQFALEDPETAATHRVLQWLWQLRNSEIGRLSLKARKYIEALHHSSFVNSHFLEQFSEKKMLRATMIRSAVAVSRIMADEKYLPHIPLLAASKKGWLWAEMVLSLVTWNKEKNILMKAEIPVPNEDGLLQRFILREIQMTNMSQVDTMKLNKKKTEPDTEAATLAFHSELATPLGWNDFEDPRRPGPQTVPILIFSSLGYFNQWEIISGNIIQTLLRLQKYNNLQHVGALLYPPHRKTALNEVRKLNKTVSSSTFHFDDNVMTKTFRRLASLRNTRSLFNPSGIYPPLERRTIFYTCEQVGCISEPGETVLTTYCGKEVECTKF